MDEPAFTSTRTDAESYADHALTPFEEQRVSFRVQCQIRDALAEAFLSGEHQGECRAIRVLSIAWANATDPAVRDALKACYQVLAGDV